MSQLLWVRLSKNATEPRRAHGGDAGYDLCAAHKAVVPARGKCIVKTDLALQPPEGHYGRIAPRSGLAWKSSIDVGGGVIDRGYQGNVGIILFNHSDVDFHVEQDDKIAQYICEKISLPEVREVQSVTDFNQIDARGGGGFGSTTRP